MDALTIFRKPIPLKFGRTHRAAVSVCTPIFQGHEPVGQRYFSVVAITSYEGRMELTLQPLPAETFMRSE